VDERGKETICPSLPLTQNLRTPSTELIEHAQLQGLVHFSFLLVNHVGTHFFQILVCYTVYCRSDVSLNSHAVNACETIIISGHDNFGA
jgi:hypothetical protein